MVRSQQLVVGTKCNAAQDRTEEVKAIKGKRHSERSPGAAVEADAEQLAKRPKRGTSGVDSAGLASGEHEVVAAFGNRANHVPLGKHKLVTTTGALPHRQARAWRCGHRFGH